MGVPQAGADVLKEALITGRGFFSACFNVKYWRYYQKSLVLSPSKYEGLVVR
jgi:hypothetical protein